MEWRLLEAFDNCVTFSASKCGSSYLQLYTVPLKNLLFMVLGFQTYFVDCILRNLCSTKNAKDGKMKTFDQLRQICKVATLQVQTVEVNFLRRTYNGNLGFIRQDCRNPQI